MIILFHRLYFLSNERSVMSVGWRVLNWGMSDRGGSCEWLMVSCCWKSEVWGTYGGSFSTIMELVWFGPLIFQFRPISGLPWFLPVSRFPCDWPAWSGFSSFGALLSASFDWWSGLESSLSVEGYSNCGSYGISDDWSRCWSSPTSLDSSTMIWSTIFFGWSIVAPSTRLPFDVG